MKKVSVVIPAKNESAIIFDVVKGVLEVVEGVELIVVNDGSEDATGRLAEEAGAVVINHPYSKGNGAAIKAGARKASGDVIVFMDGDGQHNPKDIPLLLKEMDKGFDMVVGSREGVENQAGIGRALANGVYNKLATWMVNRKVRDLTSGFRAVRAEKFKEFLYMLPNGFSYPTTSTMAFFRAGYSVGYMPIDVSARVGKSHINVFKDGVRFLLIIFKVGTLYSPLKIFFPLSVFQFFLGGGYYFFTYFYF